LATESTASKLETEKFLVPRVLGGPTRLYQPASSEKLAPRKNVRASEVPQVYRGLPLNFAHLKTENDLIEFANRFGMLGRCHTHSVELPGFRRRFVSGEPLRAWVYEIQAMNCAVELWNAARRNDWDSVADFALASLKYRLDQPPPDPGPVIIARRPLAYHNAASEYERRQQLLGLDTTDDDHNAPLVYQQFRASVQRLNLSAAFVQGMSALQKLVNNELERALRRRLFWAPDGTQELYDSPVGLFGAMWTLLALAISDNKQHAPCLNCGEWVEVSKFHREGRHYCNASCKMKAYRQRKKKSK
jgi:hypothetical protein